MSKSSKSFRLNRAVFFGLSLAVTLQLSTASQDPTSLSLDDAIRIGLDKNPQVVAGRAGVASALANYKALSVLPPVTLSGTHVSGSSTAPTLNGTSSDTFLDLGETFDFSGQRRYQAAGLNATYTAAQFTFQETLLSLEQQIRDAYWSLAATQEQTKNSEASLTEAQRVYDLTVKQQDAGASPRADVIRSSIDVANARQTLLTSRGAERTALITFNNLLAREPSTPAPLGADLGEAAALPEIEIPDLKILDAEALKTRPVIKAATDQVRVANYAVRQAEAGHLPDFSVDYQRSLQTNVDTMLLTASIPLIDFGSVSQAIKAAKETRKQNESQLKQTQQQVQQQVAQAYSDLEVALQSAADYKKEILDPSATLVGMAQLGYKQGATGILPVIDAESTLRAARLGYTNSLLAIYKAQDEMFAATGVLLKNGKK